MLGMPQVCLLNFSALHYVSGCAHHYQHRQENAVGELAKGRWIICGYNMMQFRDYGKTASPSADMIAYRIPLSMLFMMRAHERVDDLFDVTTAYLWALHPQ